MEAPIEKRLEELARRAGATGRVFTSRFLEACDEPTAEAAARRAGVRAAFWGGYPEAERRMAAFYAEEAPLEWPIRALCVTWNAKFADPAHRDLLGALMGLGIRRETLGDIAPGRYRGAPCAWVFAEEEVADYIAANLQSAGRASLKVTIPDTEPTILPPEGRTLRLTVQQERLDAIVAAAFRLSRSEAQRRIAAGLVKHNHVPCLRSDARVEEGDILSVRGHGRLKVKAFGGQNRRGRQVVEVFVYG